jgi:hypothetical protein
LFCNLPTLNKKIGFIWNKQEKSWVKMQNLFLPYFLKRHKNQNVPKLNRKKNISFFFKNDFSLGIVHIYFKISRDLIVLKFFDKLKRKYSRYKYSIKIVKKQWQNSSRANKDVVFLYFLTKTVAEIYQNIISKEFFFLTKNQLKSYVYLSEKKPLFLGVWQTAPFYIGGIAGPREIGQIIAVEKNILLLRQGTRVLLETNSFIPWKPGSILPAYRPLTAKRGRTTETNDITSGIPQIEALFEIRIQTGMPLLLNISYENFLEKKISSRVARRKAIHFGQRILIDGVQRIYQTNGVTLDDKHLELLVRPIAFVQVTQDQAQENPIIQGEKHPLELLERINYRRVIKNWQKKEVLRKWEPRVFYKPLLFGLTKGALRSDSFLSAASFQETSRVLSRAALAGRIDFLIGLKENLILGTRLPIGTNSRFLIFNYLYNKDKYKRSNNTNINLIKRRNNVIKRKKILLWLDALNYLEAYLNQKLFLQNRKFF